MKQTASPHGKRKHSAFSASGTDRWLQCPGSVSLSEGLPDKDSAASLYGTLGHEALEIIVKCALETGARNLTRAVLPDTMPLEVAVHGMKAANFILGIYGKHPGSDLLIEERVSLEFIEPEMFGTLDYAVVDVFGTLHILDYKFGTHMVSPVNNTQLIFYALAIAYRFDWNFKRVRHWVIQPRARGFDWRDNGPPFWECTMEELKAYIDIFRRGVKRAKSKSPLYTEGPHCYFCKAKGICPLKTEAKKSQASKLFGSSPINP